MRRLWTWRVIEQPAPSMWRLLTDPRMWPVWGPSVRRAEIDGGIVAPGARGRVHTLLGVRLPFEITEVDDGSRWAWRVAGVGATDHRVVALGPDRCRVGFGVPWPAAPYLAVCRTALRRLDRLGAREAVPT